MINFFEQDGWVYAKILIHCDKKKEKYSILKKAELVEM